MTTAEQNNYHRERREGGDGDAMRAAAAVAAGAARAAGSRRAAPAPPPRAPQVTSSLLERLAGGASAVAANVAWAVTGWRRSEPRWLQASRRSPWPDRPGGKPGSPGSMPNEAETPEDRRRRQECAGLLSYLRAAIDHPVPTVVIAGASAGAGTSRIADGLAEAARECGLRMFSAELGGTPGRPVLQQRRMVTLPAAGVGDRRLTAGEPDGAATGGTGPATQTRIAMPAAAPGQTSATPPGFGGAGAGAVDSDGAAGAQVHGVNGQGAPGPGRNGAHGKDANGRAGGHAGTAGTASAATAASHDARGEAPPGPQHLALETIPAGESTSGLSRWFENPGGSVDFILVEAPPLDTAADAALLARAGDGLVLVVESAVTPRDSLRRAIRIAEASGCRVLGIAMSEPHHPLPSWLSRLLSGTSRGR